MCASAAHDRSWRETQYCITVGSIPETFYAEIAANQAQREEWVNLPAIHGPFCPPARKVTCLPAVCWRSISGSSPTSRSLADF